MAGGALSRRIHGWQERLLGLAARLEAVLDFSDEGEVGEGLPEGWTDELEGLGREIETFLALPPAERLRDGVRVVITGPPNSGKSSLLNWLAGRQAAITSAIAGTTRDLVEAPTGIGGTPFLLVDTAGLRESEDEIERIGIDRARGSIDAADLVLWLGPPEDCPARAKSVLVQSKIDLHPRDPAADAAVSAETGEGMDALIALLVARAKALLPKEGEVAINARQRDAIRAAWLSLEEARETGDLLLQAEALRRARSELDRVTGRAGVDDMLDALFGRFCVGK
jgi:tRNA modification GTPase